MCTENNKQELHKKSSLNKKVRSVLVALSLITLTAASIIDKKTFNDESEVNTVLEARKVKIKDKDRLKIETLSKSLENKIEEENKALNKIADLDLQKIINTKDASIIGLSTENLKEISNYKNKDIFKYEESKIQSGPNNWLIILIILTAGIIGGWARMSYSVLSPLQNTLEDIDKKISIILAEIKAANDDAQILTLQDTLTDAQNKANIIAKQLKDELARIIDQDKLRHTSIVFGVIASSVSLLALKLADSQVLQFKETIDYFTLWAWCLLGAVYAKNTLEKIYNARFS